MIWYIWWLALASAFGILMTLIVRSLNDNVDYYVPAAEVERIENEHYRRMESANASRADDEPAPYFVHQV